MTTTTKTAVVKTTKTTITKAELKKIKAAKKTAGKIAKSASAKKNALAMKKAGKGIFAKKVLSPALAAICGAKSLPRTEVTKKIWGYIKSHKLNEGRDLKSWTRVTVDGLRNLMILLDCVFYFCRRSGHAHSSGWLTRSRLSELQRQS